MKNTMHRNFFKMLKKIAECTLIQSTLGNLPGFDFQVNALLLLQILDPRKQVACLGISFWPEHAHEALARLLETLGEFLEPDRYVDTVAPVAFAAAISASWRFLAPPASNITNRSPSLPK